MESHEAIPTVEPELLVATSTTAGDVIYCNEAWTSVLGPPSRPWAQLANEDKDLVSSSVLEAGKGTLVTNQVVSAQTSERDEPLPVLLNFIPVYQEREESKRYIESVTISGEVLAEPPSWMISQTQRHRMEALGRMTMGVAHDLNNLLSGLIGHIELLQKRLEQNSTAEPVRPSLQTIETTAEDGAALIEKLQRYIREDSQKHFEPVNLSALIEDCITLTQPYWYNEPRREGIEIDVETALEEVPNVMGAPSELREVFVNLILNAVQAMPDGGTLYFETYTNDVNHVCACVRDTGIGMTDEIQQNIFEPLFTTKGEDGTGMGLAASYGIVQEHGGDIDVTSEPGAGTEFTLSIPAAERGATTTPEEPTAELDSPQEVQALVVDDEEMVRSIFTQLLSLNGHDVDRASSGSEALSMVEESSYDIVFTDFGMPEMTGTELAQKLHERYPALPIILLTGYTDPEGAVEEVETILSKPFKLDELEATIQKYVFDAPD